MNHRDDPVERFFAREREEIDELPGHDLHFQTMLRQARRPRSRRRLWLAAGVVAAAAVGAATAGLVGVDLPGQERTAAPAGQSSTVSLPPAPSPRTPSPTTSDPEPLDHGEFRPRSISAADDTTRAVLGEARCGADSACPVLLKTDDDGQTWTNVVAFPDLRTTPDTGIADGPGQVGILRWADPEVGYLAGSTIQRTTDGGVTWADMPYEGGTVIASEVGDGLVRFVTAGECTEGVCSGPLKVHQAGSGDAEASLVVLDDDIEGITGAAMVVRGTEAFLSVQIEDETSHAYRLGREATSLSVCEEDQAVRFATPADGDGPLSALCATTDGTTSEMAVRTSEDSGESWSQPSAPHRVEGRVSGYTLVDSATPVVVTQAEGGGQVLRSEDGGESWSVAAADPVQWSWVAAGGGNRVYGLAPDAVGYLESLDGGRSWRTQVLAP